MPSIFLRAEWRNLLMFNYEVEPGVLQKYLPAGTELDDFNGIHYVSLVGFLFMNTRVRGISFPFHRTFEEVNLRFYVRYRSGGEWKRGVVFIKEIVPRRLISLVANTLYGEKYACLPMRHKWEMRDDLLSVEYSWKINGQWNFLKALAGCAAQLHPDPDEENFITEHYWGYTRLKNGRTGEYGVIHPAWRIHQVRSYDVSCSIELLYGHEFVETLEQKPISVFLAEGSEVRVMDAGPTAV